MAVLRVQEIAEGRTGALDAHFERKYTRTFQAITNNPLDDARVIFAATDLGLPYLYLSAFPTDPYAICQAIRPTQPDRDDPYLWHVAVDYATRALDPSKEASDSGGGNPNTANESPILKPPKVRWGKWSEERPFVKTADIPPLPVVNSAKQLFDPPAKTMIHGLTLHVTLNKATFDRSQTSTFVDSVNADIFQNFNPGRVHCQDITADNDYARNVQFWIVSYTFRIKYPDSTLVPPALPWDLELRDCGSMKRTNNGNNYVTEKIVDRAGRDKGVVPLDGAGQPAADGAPAKYLWFKQYRDQAFAELGIPVLPP